MERLKFETLLSDISAQVLGHPFEQVESEINKALRQIMEFFGSIGVVCWNSGKTRPLPESRMPRLVRALNRYRGR